MLHQALEKELVKMEVASYILFSSKGSLRFFTIEKLNISLTRGTAVNGDRAWQDGCHGEASEELLSDSTIYRNCMVKGLPLYDSHCYCMASRASLIQCMARC